MTVLLEQQINPQFIKTRWQEPYVSAALNSKSFKTLPRGVYRGFDLVPGPGAKEITVSTFDGFQGASGYASGAYDAASGWSVAVHESLDGFGTTLAVQEGPSGSFVFNLSGYAGGSVYLALDVDYQLGFATNAQVKIVDSLELDSEPTLVCLGRVDVPGVGPITTPNVVYNDANYPRLKPYADKNKDGFMSASQAEVVDILSTAPNAANTFEVEYIVVSSGPQIVTIPGANTYVVNGEDLLIFKNGLKMHKTRDYTEIDDGGGFGTTVSWISSLNIGDRIVFRGQQYAVSLTNTLNVLDENALVQSNVVHINFQGLGVSVVPNGPGSVNVQIPSATSSGASRSKKNETGATIPAFRAVNLKTDGTIELCNPVNLAHKVLGITANDIADGDFGLVALDANLALAVSGLGFLVGDDVYVDHTGLGTLTNVAPNPMSGQVIRVGIADCTDNTASSTAVDLVFDKQRLV